MKTGLLTSLVIYLFTLPAQGNYELVNPCSFEISGTSTRHDWTMTCNTANAWADIEFENDSVINIKTLELSLYVKDLKSDKRILERNAHKTLKQSAHPSIIYSLIKLTELSKNNDGFQISAGGWLTVAGVKKEVPLHVKAVLGKDDLLYIEGETALLFEDFEMKPPSYLGGSLRTGSEVWVKFKIQMRRKNI